MPSFSIPLTGLESDNTALNTIANNLANMSTVGFKAQTTQFANLIYQQYGENGAGDPLQAGTGVAIGATETDFSEGPTTATGNATDMELDGQGFFAIDDGGTMELTRAGNFTTSADGTLLTAGGAAVMGYPAVNGVVNDNATLVPVVLPVNQIQYPKASTTISFLAQLNATAAVNTVVPATLDVYDSLGVAHSLTINMTNAGSNKWTYSMSLPAGDATASTNTTGTLSFNSSGELTSPVPALPAATFSGLSDGAATLSFATTTVSPSGNPLITQVGSTSTVSNTITNGYTAGIYQGFSTSSDGTISANYSNGVIAPVAQLAVGNVADLQGLTQAGGNAYLTTITSGVASYGVAGVGANGTVQADSLESSNVDISKEFSNLIVAQRAFEANSKSITTFDTITQETINMIH